MFSRFFKRKSSLLGGALLFALSLLLKAGFRAVMPFYVIEGELRPKVYMDMASARRACTSPLWHIRTYHTLAEAGAAREAFKTKSAPEALRKKQRVTTEVLTQTQFEDKCGVVEDVENEGFGRWLAGQQHGDTPQYYDAEAERKRAADKAWFEEFKARQAAKKAAKEEEARRRKEQPQYKPQQQGSPPRRPPPPRQSSSVPSAREALVSALSKLGIHAPLAAVTIRMLKDAKKRLVLANHPDKQKKGNTEDEKARNLASFRDGMEAFEYLTDKCGYPWPAGGEKAAAAPERTTKNVD